MLKALIVEAANIDDRDNADGYRSRVVALILDQLRRARTISAVLPWPREGRLSALCEALYLNPADERSADDWAKELGMSSRTLTRRFEADLGSTLRSWKRRLRLFRAIALLGGGMSVSQTALELGYASASAFIYAFKAEMGSSPHAYRERKAAAAKHGCRLIIAMRRHLDDWRRSHYVLNIAVGHRASGGSRRCGSRRENGRPRPSGDAVNAP